MAEEKGFEPLRRLPDLPVFKTGPFNQTWVFLHFQGQVDYNIIKKAMSTLIMKKYWQKLLNFLRKQVIIIIVLLIKTVPAQVAE